MKKLKLIAVLFSILATGGAAQAQEISRGAWSLGGSLGLSFGDNTVISIAPQVGYNWNRYLTVGGGFSYSHYDYKDQDYKRNYYGANLFVRAYPIEFMTVFVQPEILRFEAKDELYGYKDKDTFASFIVGAGIVAPVGYNGRVITSVYYDVVQNRNSPYKSQLGYSVGYSFAF